MASGLKWGPIRLRVRRYAGNYTASAAASIAAENEGSPLRFCRARSLRVAAGASRTCLVSFNPAPAPIKRPPAPKPALPSPFLAATKTPPHVVREHQPRFPHHVHHPLVQGRGRRARQLRPLSLRTLRPARSPAPGPRRCRHRDQRLRLRARRHLPPSRLHQNQHRPHRPLQTRLLRLRM